jgi:cytosine deaminase
MDLVFRNARLAEAGPADPLVDIAVKDGRIAAIGPKLDVPGPERDLAGALACAGLVECHIHLDKAHIFERTAPETGRNADSVRRTSPAKHSFTAEDVHRRASKVLARAVAQGTTRIRTQLELDPIVYARLRGRHAGDPRFCRSDRTSRSACFQRRV